MLSKSPDFTDTLIEVISVLFFVFFFVFFKIGMTTDLQ